MAEINKKALIGYIALAFPLGYVAMPIYIFAPDFYASSYGLSLATLGTIIFFNRLIDAFQDPFFGWVSDRWPNLVSPLMLGALLVLAGSFLLLFIKGYSQPLMMFAVLTFVITSAYSFLTINLNALGATWAETGKDKIRVNSARETTSMMGLVLSLFLFAQMQQVDFDTSDFQSFAWTFVIVVSLCAFLFWSWHRQLPPRRQTASAKIVRFRETLIQLSPSLRAFYVVYGFSMLASAIPAVLVLFFVRDVLNLEEWFSYLILLYFASGAVSVPIWRTLAVRFGALKVWSWSMIMAIVVFVWAFFLAEGALVSFVIICLGSGAAFGADMVMPPSLVAILGGCQKKQGNFAQYYSLVSFLGKMALALATLLTFSLLDLAAFVPGAVNSSETLLFVSFLYAVLPCMLKVLALILVFRLQASPNVKDTTCAGSSSPPLSSSV